MINNIKLTKASEVIEASSNVLIDLFNLIEKEIQENKTSFSDCCLNICIENCPEKSLTTSNLAFVEKSYVQIGWDQVDTYPVEENNRLRIKFYKY